MLSLYRGSAGAERGAAPIRGRRRHLSTPSAVDRPRAFATGARSRTVAACLLFPAEANEPSPPGSRKEARSMAAQTHYFENDLLGAFPGLLLVLVLILTALGVIAHAAFA